MRLKVSPLLCAALVAVLTFVLYALTLAPAVNFIDSGELATVAATLGIAHPTGYPLFSILGWIFSKLPIASSVIVRLNLMSALFTALASGVMTLLVYELLANWFVVGSQVAQKRKQRTKSVADKLLTSTQATALASLTGLSAGLSQTWWAQGTALEVYSLHIFLISLTLLYFIRAIRKGERRDEILFAAFLGLAFTNHLTTILLAPALLVAFFQKYGFSQPALRRIRGMIIPFVGALLVYLYLPIRSSQYPLMDWGHPADWSGFTKHVTGGQYKIWMFSSGDAAKNNWGYFWSNLPREFFLGVLLVTLVGIYASFKVRREHRVSLGVLTQLLFFTCVLYSINYDIHDIDSYFLLAYLVIALWFAFGLAYVLLQEKIKTAAVLGVATALVVIQAALNYPKVDESGNYFVEDYALNVLKNAPPNAIIFSSQWDFWVSAAFYYQLVEGVRPDVLVIDKAMLRDRPYYFSHLKQRAPDVMKNAEPELSNFMPHLVAFDRGDPFDPNQIAEAYRAFSEALVEKNKDRPIFITSELLGEDELFAPSFARVPAGYQFRLMPRDSFVVAVPPKLQWRDDRYQARNYYTDKSRTLQAIPLAAYAELASRIGRTDLAVQFLDLALLFHPEPNVNLELLSGKHRASAMEADDQFARIASFRQQLLQSPPRAK